MSGSRGKIFSIAVSLMLGVVVGHLSADRSEEIAVLEARLAEVEGANGASGSTGARQFLRANLDGSPGPSRTVHSVPPGMPPGVTPEDYEEHKKLWELRHRGEFFLRYESPVARRILEDSIERRVQRHEAERRAEEYDQIFQQAGVPPEAAERLDRHLSKIVKASLEADVTIQQLADARQEYDKRLRESMTPEGYEQYRQYEAGRLGRREMEMFSEFLTKRSVSMDAETSQLLASLVSALGAHTTKSWHGPFDGVPESAIGYEAVIGGLQEDLSRQVAAAAKLQVRAQEAGLPADMEAALNDYYLQRIETTRSNLEGIMQWQAMSPDEKLRIVRQQAGFH